MESTQAVLDRRRSDRRSVGTFANKYVRGRPYAVELVDVSSTGVSFRRISEPEVPAAETEALTVELWIDERPVFAWARRVRRIGDHEAYRLVAVDPIDQARLGKFLRRLIM